MDSSEEPGKTLAAHVDFSRVGLAGHSLGGDAVLLAADSLPQGIQVGGILLIAPFVAENRAIPEAPLLVLLPAADGDVVDLDGARAYDAAAFGWKSMLYIYGGTHNRFNREWHSPDRDDPMEQFPDLVSREEQEDILRLSSRLFFDRWLGDATGDREYEAFFTGDGEVLDLRNDKLVKSFQRGGGLRIDDFEDRLIDPHSAMNSLSGTVTVRSADYFRELRFGSDRENDVKCEADGSCDNDVICTPYDFCWESYNQSFHHDTAGLVAAWIEGGDFQSAIPEPYWGEAASHEILSFRVARVYETPGNGHERHRNQAETNTTLTIEIRDASGRVAATVVSVPYPYERDRDSPDYAATVLGTTRLPLRCFVDIDREKLAAVRFSVDSPALLAFDDIELTE